ncbi:MAG: ATP-binding protein [Vulcanimicrobiota bacterium]
MDSLLVLQNRHWKNERYGGLIERKLLQAILHRSTLKEIQVLMGMRRSGKSSIFRLLINELMIQSDPRCILYANLDDPFFSELWREPRQLHILLESAEKITGMKVRYLFLDEVQNVTGWEKFVKSLYDNDIVTRIYVSGSNSNLLAGEYATLLSGRYIKTIVYPLSFREILNHRQIRSPLEIAGMKADILRLIDDTLKFGSFPEVYKTEDAALKRDLLISYYETILLKDCIALRMIRDKRTFSYLAHYLITNSGSFFSYNSLAHTIGSNENTVKEYVQILEDSFLFREIRSFSYSLKISLKAKKKLYCLDNGIPGALSFSFSENRGRLFENLVYSELVKNGFDEVFFYPGNKECDFIVKKDNVFIAIQATIALGDHNLHRELEGLRSAMSVHELKIGYIITVDKEEIIDDSVSVVPLWSIDML